MKNKQGYFDDNNQEYVITDMFPRRDLLNYLWNGETVCALTQFGDGNCWVKVGQGRRQLDMGPRLVYIKDNETGAYYSANRNFKREQYERFEAHVGLGYHKVISCHDELESSYSLLVPLKGNALLQKIEIRNMSKAKKSLEVVLLNTPTPMLAGHAYDEAKRAEEFEGIIYSYIGQGIHAEYPYLWMASEKKIQAIEVSPHRFLGNYRGYEEPLALDSGLSNKGSGAEPSYIGAMQFHLELQPGETWENEVALGMAKDPKDAAAQAEEFVAKDRFEEELDLQKKKNASYSNVFTLESPDSVLNSQVNFWLKRQTALGKDWGRVYGKGFRDVTQDITAFVSMDVPLGKQRLLTILKHQYEDGNPIRMFEPDYLYPYNDGASWIPAALLSYINESGDTDVLKCKVPYLPGKSSEHWNTQDGVFFYREYVGTDYEESVFTHVKKGVDYLLSSKGERGLILFLGGDWNDSMNTAGLEGKGESVWLSIATVKAINEWIEILHYAKREDLVPYYETKRDELKAAILKFGVDRDHLIYGYDDLGRTIGAKESRGPHIFLNPQTWAVLAGLSDKKTLELYMDSAESELRCDYGYLQCFPSYTEGDDHIGRISYLKPGIVENGGVYNHGVAFKIVADCLLGHPDKAYESYRMIRFDNEKNPDNGMEPYAVSNMYIGPENPYQAGYAPMSWITGTAGWIYRAMTEYVCGVQPVGDGLRIVPCLPSSWHSLRVTRVLQGTTFHLEYLEGDEGYLEENGKRLDSNTIALNENKNRYITVHFVHEE